tara:strand:+ start:2068 stop:2292 length:225 start_codon:yes stop_codon:yes gene_type:complete
MVGIKDGKTKRKGLAMATKKDKGKKWDGRSRPATELYKKNYNDIFKNPKMKKKKDDYFTRPSLVELMEKGVKEE